MQLLLVINMIEALPLLATMHRHMEIIKALVEAGADIQMPNHFGGTCLINR